MERKENRRRVGRNGPGALSWVVERRASKAKSGIGEISDRVAGVVRPTENRCGNYGGLPEELK